VSTCASISAILPPIIFCILVFSIVYSGVDVYSDRDNSPFSASKLFNTDIWVVVKGGTSPHNSLSCRDAVSILSPWQKGVVDAWGVVVDSCGVVGVEAIEEIRGGTTIFCEGVVES